MLLESEIKVDKSLNTSMLSCHFISFAVSLTTLIPGVLHEGLRSSFAGLTEEGRCIAMEDTDKSSSIQLEI